MKKNTISASILSANFANLGEDIKNALAAGVDSIHFDVMDHHYVPNLTFGAVVCESLRKAGITAPIDVHLMVDHPTNYIESFAKAGANLITFHPETVSSVEHTLKEIRDHGLKAGLAFNPDQVVDIEDYLLPLTDMILIMTVKPGFGGQSFKHECLQKITETQQRIKKSNHPILLGVDGGIKNSTIHAVAEAGANFFVVGSGLFHSHNYKETIDQMRQAMIR